jgi:long-chain acyl-CoA synthetase
MALRNVPLYPQMTGKPPFTVEAAGYQKKEGETIPRRHPAAKDQLIAMTADNVRTIYELVKRSAEMFGNAKAMGSRKLIKAHHEVKKVKKMVDGTPKEVDKTWTYLELSGYSYMSFVEYENLTLNLGAGLRKLGMSKGDKLHLFAATRRVPLQTACRSCELTISREVPIGWPPRMAQCHSPCPSPRPMTASARTA